MTNDPKNKPGIDPDEKIVFKVDDDDEGLTFANEDNPADEIIAEMEALKAENTEMRDKMLRALAEAENTRRRAVKDKSEAEKFGGTRMARDMLSVYDNLERALSTADSGLKETAPDFISGVELTFREILNVFAKHNIEAIQPDQGTRFDPNLHQAVFEAPVPGVANGAVCEVMQTGFRLEDRLLRPAMVGVSRGSPETAPAEPAAPAAPEVDEQEE